jgi:hypothetical protein
MPPRAKILSAREVDEETIGMWAEVDKDAIPRDYERRLIFVCYTGHGSAPEGARFIGTAMLHKVGVVAHVFADR